MTKEEIKTALENAISRGESKEDAVQSLISAGYNTEEVSSAAAQINLGIIGNLPKKTLENSDYQTEYPSQENLEKKETILQEEPNFRIPEPEKRISRKLIVFLIILAIFIIIFVLLVIFGENILKFFFGR